MKQGFVLMTVGSLLIAPSYADQARDYQDGYQTAKAMQSAPQNAAASLNASTTFKDYTESPSQTSYYQGDFTRNDSQLIEDGLTKLTTDDNAKTVVNAAVTTTVVKTVMTAEVTSRRQLC